VRAQGAGESSERQARFAACLTSGSCASYLLGALVNAGARVNARNRTGASPLHLCALNGQCDAARILVEQRDADLTAEDEAGMQPLHTACSVGDVRIAECLVSLGADATAGVKGNGNTACHVAAREGHPAVVRMLLEKCGCDRVLTALNDAHEQPLHRAAAHGQKEIVSCLVKAGADVAAKDSNGDTSLHLAAMFGMSEVRLLSTLSSLALCR
jgi:ankyrin repeat protein